MSDIKEDHRVRVAMMRRERMRGRLLRAVMACYARRKQQIDDVIEEAAVSRATFYKYFSSVDEALEEASRHLQEELRNDISVFIDSADDPLKRLSAGVQIFLMRSVTDPTWGAFMSQTNYLERDFQHRTMIAAQLLAAREQGLMDFEDEEAATSLLIGAMMQAAEHLSYSGRRERSYVEELNVLILRAFGVSIEHARAIVRDRVIYVRGLAPDKLSWWRDPWVNQPGSTDRDG